MAIDLPIYLDSPQLFVTSEHIMSDICSTSSSCDSLSPASGDPTALRGLKVLPSREDIAPVVEPAAADSDSLDDEVAFKAAVLSASRFSRVPKSVFPLSSSGSSPESLSKDSIRPSR